MKRYASTTVVLHNLLVSNQIPKRFPTPDNLHRFNPFHIYGAPHTFIVERCFDRSLPKVNEFSSVHSVVERHKVSTEYKRHDDAQHHTRKQDTIRLAVRGAPVCWEAIRSGDTAQLSEGIDKSQCNSTLRRWTGQGGADPTVKNEVPGISLGHQEKRCITRGNVFCGNCDNEACDTEEFRSKDMEEFLPSLVRVSGIDKSNNCCKYPWWRAQQECDGTRIP